ncbi:unnamed protein product [Didymodactylos carnosus]|uniref:Cystatin domain-containing protein n=1 Tax=Didymodactylos carnosus TaxID=1234261 RepID=A0A813QVQ2_9BILA|nr:unnamed protein product [Didymodactylos carnosus]CAF0940527.1 unnamed protein product [Didymodactylos carnosus]CAF3555004.1 unnamed protein product [Didymodactylos carnosus]CAF3715717.1 unnamed protein product [Didymodactylos carnosus]
MSKPSTNEASVPKGSAGSHAESTTLPEGKKLICGGVGESKPIENDDQQIYDQYKTHIEKKVRHTFTLPDSFKLPAKPTSVAKQIVSGTNYFFKVQVPDNKFATVRVYHCPWGQHGTEDCVAVHEKLSADSNEAVSHF